MLSELVPAFFKSPGQLGQDTYDFQSIGFVKGWTRCLGMVVAAKILMDLDAAEPSMTAQKDPDYTVVQTNTVFGAKQSYMQCKMESGCKRLLISSCASKHDVIIQSLRKFGEQLAKKDAVSNPLQWEHVRSVTMHSGTVAK